MKRTRVLVVDDSAVIRRLVAGMIESDPDLEVVAAVPNGRVALDRLEEVAPDVMTLDVEMPVMNGLETLEHVRRIAPRLPVIMFSTLTERGARETLRALFLGATDCIAKPSGLRPGQDGYDDVRIELVAKIRSAARLPERRATAPADLAGPATPRSTAEVPIARPRLGVTATDILGIGISTGGPAALSTLLDGIPGGFPVPIVIVQHMPPTFTRMLAEQLDRKSALTVREAADGDVLEPGGVWIAPGNFHMEVRRQGANLTARIIDGPKENSCRPAVDVLFRSIAEVFGARSLVVVMTGMGSDGLKGCREIAAKGGEIWVQDEASSVVWGMPGEVARAGLAHEILPLDVIRPRLAHLGRPRAASAATGGARP